MKRKGSIPDQLRHEISMAVRWTVHETVCVVTVLDGQIQTSVHTQEHVCSAVDSQLSDSYDIIAAHAEGGMVRMFLSCRKLSNKLLSMRMQSFEEKQSWMK